MKVFFRYKNAVSRRNILKEKKGKNSFIPLSARCSSGHCCRHWRSNNEQNLVPALMELKTPVGVNRTYSMPDGVRERKKEKGLGERGCYFS